MIKRLSDDDLRDVASYELLPALEDVADIARELVELRKAVADGPVMAEVPSDEVVRFLVNDGWEKDCVQPNWYDIRTALLKEQGRE